MQKNFWTERFDYSRIITRINIEDILYSDISTGSKHVSDKPFSLYCEIMLLTLVVIDIDIALMEHELIKILKR